MRAFDLRWAVQNVIYGERKYRVSGSFAFVMSRPYDHPALVSLKRFIGATGDCFTWNDDVHPSAGEPKGIFFIGIGQVANHNLTPPVQICWFSVSPRHEYMRWAQARAYEKYLAKIAEWLSKRYLPGVAEVRSFVHIDSVATSFPVERQRA